jgi:preprotein translocase subunit SecE
MVKNFIDYAKKVKAEMEKVAWPTRKELSGSTGVVLVLVAIVTVYLAVIDFIFLTIVTKIIGL